MAAAGSHGFGSEDSGASGSTATAGQLDSRAPQQDSRRMLSPDTGPASRLNGSRRCVSWAQKPQHSRWQGALTGDAPSTGFAISARTAPSRNGPERPYHNPLPDTNPLGSERSTASQARLAVTARICALQDAMGRGEARPSQSLQSAPTPREARFRRLPAGQAKLDAVCHAKCQRS